MTIEDGWSNIRAKSPFIMFLVGTTLSAMLDNLFKDSLDIRTMLSYNIRLKGYRVMLVMT
jgi:hypothetical protein